MSKLTPKQAAFVREYLVDLNATAAGLRAGYSHGMIGRRLMTVPKVVAAIEKEMAERSKRTEITVDRVLQEYARIAFFDIRKLAGDDGKPFPLSALDDDTARAIVGIDVVSIGNAESGFGEVLKFKMADKKGALDSIAKHLGMFTGKSKDDDDAPPPTKVEIIVKDARKPSQ